MGILISEEQGLSFSKQERYNWRKIRTQQGFGEGRKRKTNRILAPTRLTTQASFDM